MASCSYKTPTNLIHHHRLLTAIASLYCSFCNILVNSFVVDDKAIYHVGRNYPELSLLVQNTQFGIFVSVSCNCIPLLLMLPSMAVFLILTKFNNPSDILHLILINIYPTYGVEIIHTISSSIVNNVSSSSENLKFDNWSLKINNKISYTLGITTSSDKMIDYQEKSSKRAIPCVP